MQLKIVTHDHTFRFNQKGQLIQKITEPFAYVEILDQDDIVALYDAFKEHLYLAFTYNGAIITGLSDDYTDNIQNFLLIDGAFYLKELYDPSTDVVVEEVEEPEAFKEEDEPVASDTVTAKSNTPVSLDIPGFVASPEQRKLLKELQNLSDKLRKIAPQTGDTWAQVMQRQLNAILYFGSDNLDKVIKENQDILAALISSAMVAGIPENVITLNTMAVDLSDPSEESEDEVA